MKESFKKTFLMNMLKWVGRSCGKNGKQQMAKISYAMPRKWREKGSEEDQVCDGRTALRDI